MSAVNVPLHSRGDWVGSVIVEETNAAERELSGAVDSMIAAATRALQQPTTDANSNTTFAKTASLFRANGIRISPGESDEDGVSTAQASGADSDLRTQLEYCRDLLRKVDSERRHMRKVCLRLQREQELSLSETQTMHRYSTESHQRSLALERHAAEERQRRLRLQDEVDQQTLEVMRLRRILRALPGNVLASAGGAGGAAGFVQALAPDRRFEEAFRDKMNSIVYKRRYHQASAMHQATSERLEAVMMEQHDPQWAAAQWSFAGDRGAAAVAAAADRDQHESSGGAAHSLESASAALGTARQDDSMSVSAATTLANSSFMQSALDFPFQLPFTTASPQDAYIKFLVYNSAYAEPLTRLREHVLRLSSRLKTAQDAGLRALYTMFTQALRSLSAAPVQTQWRSQYERQMEQVQRAHRDLLYGLVEQVNAAATQIPELERGGAGAAAARRDFAGAAPQRCDVGCSARESTTMEEYRASQLKEQLAHLKLHSLEAAAAAHKKAEELARQRTAARQEAVNALQSLKALAKCVVSSVRVQGGAEDVVYDPFAHLHDPLTEGVLDDPRLTTKTMEATDMTISYVRLLARSAGAPRNRTRAGAGQLSSSYSSAPDGAREDAFGHIIDIHRPSSRVAAPPPRPPKAQSSRRQSAPSALHAVRLRSRSNSANGAGRRMSAPQLPPMATPPPPQLSGPRNPRRGKSGNSGAATAAAAPPPPPRGDFSSTKDSTASSREDEVESPADAHVTASGPAPQTTVAVIDLGFHVSRPRG
ncbi:hypothetical protein NESM_000049900 [Novymonas esmeraldas]|uniref:Uncharacterized protein n=1 Tax=Novymonas esmeraldas TaxID=1808958 RepID=A0AAW0F3L3_9TRYP